MALSPERTTEEIKSYRRDVTKLLDALDDLRSHYQRYLALDLATILTDADFIGANSGMTKTEFLAGVTAANNVVTTIDGAVATVARNLARMRI